MEVKADAKISWIHSLITYMKYMGTADMLSHAIPQTDGVCSICHGLGYVHTDADGVFHCLHMMQERQRTMDMQYRSFVRNDANLDKFQPWGTDDNIDNIITAKDSIAKWMKKPDKWLTILGPTGNGKTLIAQSIANKFKTWARYVSCDDLESWLMQGINDETVETIMFTLRYSPILILDDFGAEYNKAGGWIKAKISAIINFRYNFRGEMPTIVVSNYSEGILASYDQRIASRILDSENSLVIKMKIGDYRNGKR